MKSVLIVDNSSQSRIDLKTAIEESKQFEDILEAESGSDAVELTKKLKPDVVVLTDLECVVEIKKANDQAIIIILPPQPEIEKIVESIKMLNKKAKIKELTERETDVLRLIVEGYNNAEISQKLCVSIHTAKAHVCNILHKLCVEDRTQAAILALKHKII